MPPAMMALDNAGTDHAGETTAKIAPTTDATTAVGFQPWKYQYLPPSLNSSSASKSLSNK